MGGGQFNCVKCGGDTLKGFAADRSDAAFFTARWVDGEPVNKSFLGITANNVDVNDAEERTIRGLRCSKCGFLELYAV